MKLMRIVIANSSALPILQRFVRRRSAGAAARQRRARWAPLIAFYRIEQLARFLAAHLSGRALIIGPCFVARLVVRVAAGLCIAWRIGRRLPLTGWLALRRLFLRWRLSLTGRLARRRLTLGRRLTLR
jgi:hypothetical protein